MDRTGDSVIVDVPKAYAIWNENHDNSGEDRQLVFTGAKLAEIITQLIEQKD